MDSIELGFCSQKVRDRIKGPLFIGSEEECNRFLQKSDHFFCHFHFPDSNGEVTVYGQLKTIDQTQVITVARFFSNVQGAPLAFLDALIELAHNKDSASLSLLKPKEIEAYLRTKNSEPSFPNDGIQLLRYYELIHALKHTISKKRDYSIENETDFRKQSPTIEEYIPHSRHLFNREEMGAFVQLELNLKLKIVNEILTIYVRPLLQRDGGDVECIHVMDNLIVLIYHGNCRTCEMSLATTMDFIKNVIRTELSDKNLNLITD